MYQLDNPTVESWTDYDGLAVSSSVDKQERDISVNALTQLTPWTKRRSFPCKISMHVVNEKIYNFTL